MHVGANVKKHRKGHNFNLIKPRLFEHVNQTWNVRWEDALNALFRVAEVGFHVKGAI